jgi:hypothetical protein
MRRKWSKVRWISRVASEGRLERGEVVVVHVAVVVEIALDGEA